MNKNQIPSQVLEYYKNQNLEIEEVKNSSSISSFKMKIVRTDGKFDIWRREGDGFILDHKDLESYIDQEKKYAFLIDFTYEATGHDRSPFVLVLAEYQH